MPDVEKEHCALALKSGMEMKAVNLTAMQRNITVGSASHLNTNQVPT